LQVLLYFQTATKGPTGLEKYDITANFAQLNLGNMADEVSADRTPGFKVGEKKTLDEYHKLGKSRVGYQHVH